MPSVEHDVTGWVLSPRLLLRSAVSVMYANGVTHRQSRLRNRQQTVTAMYDLVRNFHGDLRESGHAAMPFHAFWSWLSSVPFRRDDWPHEIVARPRYLTSGKKPLDCKKKSLLMASWLACNGMPENRWRFVTVSRRPDGVPHHVYTQVRISGMWRNLDATYPGYVPFAPQLVTGSEVY